jgi:hypothetical protein
VIWHPITGNTALNGDGGGIHCNIFGSPTISDCTISGNTAGGNGGVYCNSGCSPTISSGTFTSKTPSAIDGDFILETPKSATGACCIGLGCIILTASDCTSTGGNYVGDDVSCLDAGCSTQPAIGPCCVSSGCQLLSGDDCAAIGGSWLGKGGDCDQCPPSSSVDMDNDGDGDGDGDGDTDDLEQLHATLGICKHDVNHNGQTDIDDLLLMIEGWGSVCP